MAKGMEDTSFYVYNRLLSLNDVGSDPRRFGTSVTAFHHANQQRLKQWPDSLITLSTHDSKRSGDVRARINVLSEMAAEWRHCLSRWRRSNRGKKTRMEGRLAPSANAEYLLYQTLLGTWPLKAQLSDGEQAFAERIEAYLLKAVREAKINTSWINPNREYETAVSHFVQALLNPKKSATFLADFVEFQNRLSRFGFYNSLSQALLLLTSPGIPDIYQGTELWNYTLVDPDNRRPVDFGIRQCSLNQLFQAENKPNLDELMAHIEDGRAKLFLISKTLSLRKAYPALFRRGDYQPLEISGDKAEHICAFLRQSIEISILVVVSRWCSRLTPGQLPHTFAWLDTKLIIADNLKNVVFQNVFTGVRLEIEEQNGMRFLPAAKVFEQLPCALFVSKSNE